MQANFQMQYKHNGRRQFWNVDFHPMENYFLCPFPYIKSIINFFTKNKKTLTFCDTNNLF